VTSVTPNGGSAHGRLGRATRNICYQLEKSKDEVRGSDDQETAKWIQGGLEQGKNLGGPYKTLEEAKKRLRQVEFFKRRGATAKRGTRRKG